MITKTGFIDLNVQDKTLAVMPSSRQMTNLCRLGLPVARVLAGLHLVSQIMVLNNQWGTYQQGLFESGATSYNVLTASKP